MSSDRTVRVSIQDNDKELKLALGESILDAALAQQFVCPLEITLRLGERSFAIHHARAGLVAKRLYVSC